METAKSTHRSFCDNYRSIYVINSIINNTKHCQMTKSLIQRMASSRRWGMLIGIFLLSAFTTAVVYGQTIRGTITDASSGEPIIGASVLEKDTENNGTTTDFDGLFELTAQTESPVLIISYVGYQTIEVPYNGEEMLNIQIQGG